jgi:ornithine cyclodeaminase
MLLEGVHINSVGSIDLERKEFEPEILADCASVVTDSVAQAGNFSAELREFYGTDSANWSTVRSLGELVSTVSVPRSPSDVTLFKGMGSGVEDMALGAAVLARLGAQNPVVSIKRAGRAKVDFLGSADNR